MVRRFVVLGVAVLCGCATTALQTVTQERWHEVRSPHFVLWTAGDAREGEALIADLERFHQVMLSKTTAQEREATPPLRIFMVRDRASFNALVPDYRTRRGARLQGIARPTSRGIFAVIDASANAGGDGDEQDERREVLFHEYVHYMMALGGAKVPSWYSEGMAEYMATTRFRADGSYTLGCPPLSRTRLASHREWIPLSEVMQAEYIGKLMSPRGDSYMQSWYVVHYLVWDQDRAESLSRYLARFAEGVEHGQALQETFGVSASEFDLAVREYAKGKTIQCAAITPARPLQIPAVQTRAVSQAEAGLQVGELLLSTVGPSTQTIELLQHAERNARGDSRGAVALARAHYLKASKDKNLATLQRAESYLERARSLSPDDPALHVVEGHVLLLRASLIAEEDLQQAKESLQRARSAYRKAIRADETLAEAYAGLGSSYLMQDNGSKEAIVVLEAAAYLLPSYVQIPLWLAQLHMRRGNPMAAVAPLQYAMVHTDDRALQEKAASLLDQIVNPGAAAKRAQANE